jgi:formylglycine-generating enzyme required for sulfatase activity
MKLLSHIMLAAMLLLAGGARLVAADAAPAKFVYETEREFITTGDFDGDGRPDLVIANRDNGRIRLGCQATAGVFTWSNYVASGLKDLSGMTVGRLFSEKKDALAVASADANGVVVIEVESGGQAGLLVTIPPPGLGPNCVVAADIGGAGKTPLQDLFLNTTYTTPNQVTLYRNAGVKFTKLGAQDMPGAVVHGNRLPFRSAQPELVCFILNGDQGDTFQVDNLSAGKLETVAALKGLPAGSDYVLGHFRSPTAWDLLLFKAGTKQITVRPLEGEGAAVQFGEAKNFDLAEPVKSLFVVPADGGDKLLAVFGTNASGAVFTFDGAQAPQEILALQAAEAEMLNGAAVFPNGFLLLSASTAGKARHSTRYQQFALSGKTCTPGLKGSLPSLSDSDDATVPEIHKMIMAKLQEKTEADMKRYTNTIPGTAVKYGMIPVPGGEFLMGSPADEKKRKPDEGPQRKVKIEPFWMGQFEVTWNEYELFVYTDEERKFKDTFATDPEVDKLSDAVSRPSRPYVEMSFGMGKDGFPAIAMTHHAANKYCQWLSAKTGHFYRLPTEAEWEYACRAGTSTAYSFGDDVSKLPDYGWFEDNSDFKYQKCGKKKPNPWGLFDMHGNVTEWCLDGYDANYFTKLGDSLAVLPWNKATQPYPHAVRGGSWDEPAANARSAARRGSERAWKQTDPQMPKSIWWLSDSQWVGFRLIRPLKVPPPEELLKYWKSGTEKD